MKIDVYNVLVQGVDAPASLEKAVQKANQLSDAETLVIVRGGGSKDDLAAFDHEAVVRAIAASRIPTLVAIGHERDESLSELAADARASTPSNAAELLVPDRVEVMRDLKQSQKLLSKLHQSITDQHKNYKLETLRRIEASIGQIIIDSKKQIGAYKRIAHAYDPQNLLKKGYTIVRSEDGSVLTSKESFVAGGAKGALSFHDGVILIRDDELKK